MALIEQQDWDHLRWRVWDGVVNGSDTATGPTDLAGKQPIWLPRAIKALAADVRAGFAADATRDAATAAALKAISDAIAAGGGNLEIAPILARIDERTAEVRADVEQRHQAEMAELEQLHTLALVERDAELASLRAELDRLTAGTKG